MVHEYTDIADDLVAEYPHFAWNKKEFQTI